MGKLDGQGAFITGGARGIGFATAVMMTKEGATVGVADLDGDGAARAAKDLAQYGHEGVPFTIDVSKREQVDQAIDGFREKTGRLDILVNNAGITRDGLLMRMTDEQWDLVLKIHLYGTFYGTRAAVKHMIKARTGRIISVASVVGVWGNAGQANYAAAKAGIIGFTRAVAKEVGSRNITVNAVAPGFIKTALTDQMNEEARNRIIENIRLGRLGVPEDVAGSILFLASPEASYITGQVIQMDGGLTM